MYKMAPASQPLPGTQLIQRVNGDGLGAYVGTPTYWGTPAAQAGIRGMGCGCGCDKGFGFFDSGLEFSGWGWQEWAAVAFGGYMVLSTVFTTSRGVRAARGIPGARRKRKAAALRARASELTKKRK